MTIHSRIFEVEIQLPVKPYDIDLGGVVSNIVYVRWLEDLRIEILNHHFPLEEQLHAGIAPLVLQTKIDYKQVVRITDRPVGKMWVESLGSLRWHVSAEILILGSVSAIAQQMGIFVNSQSSKPIRMPDKLKQKYEESLQNCQI